MGSKHSLQIIPDNSNYKKTNYKKFIIGIIDVQNDFCKAGKLSVAEAEFAIAAINKLRYIYDEHIKVFISQDWHNERHMSFAETHKKAPNTGPEDLRLIMEDGTLVDVKQMMWPSHCVENTPGSELHSDLIVTKNDIRIKKGTKKNVESYSAFGDEFKGKYEKTNLNELIKALEITDIILTGIASDYCVYNTALDALRLGYNVHIILSCTRGVSKTTTDKAFDDLKKKGVIFYDTVDNFHQINESLIIR
uniref:nicotinamidase n=1 Tax=viral metagenome TaxID=1070528 RepID=A0A6C0EST3_9ZZZZ